MAVKTTALQDTVAELEATIDAEEAKSQALAKAMSAAGEPPSKAGTVADQQGAALEALHLKVTPDDRWITMSGSR
jgi:outer membrane murein-binding lipoprotein Lpp